MKFTPKTEAQLTEENLITPGIYPFDVISAKDTVSKKGNEMIEIELLVFIDSERESRVFDYLMEKLSWKLRHFCEHTGLIEKYNAGLLEAPMIEGRQGYCKIEVQEAKDGYGARNVVKDYVSKPAPAGQEAKRPHASDPRSTGAVTDHLGGSTDANKLEDKDIPF